jgi:ketosteroid isomerase-like protein
MMAEYPTLNVLFWWWVRCPHHFISSLPKPKAMTTQEAVMTTQEIADRFYQLSQQNDWARIQSELFSDDAESVEPAHVADKGGLVNAKGREALIQKGKTFQESTEEFHGGFSGKPIIAGNYFAVAMGLDATMKGMGRMKMEEIALYEVKDGKIVKEQFFY